MHKMKGRLVLGIGLMMMGFSSLCPAVESFYLKALRDGKTAYHEGRFEQAIDDLKIAEFGLLEDKEHKEHLSQLYLYYALCWYKLGKVEECREILNLLKTELNIKELDNMTGPPQIENDVRVMLSTLGNYGNRSNIEGHKDKKAVLVESYEERFQKVREDLKNNNLPGIESQIQQLRRLNKEDDRIAYLKGVYAFKNRNYKDCIEILITVRKTIDPTFRNDVYHYLALSYYFLKNYGQTLAFYQKIDNPADREKLKDIIRKVIDIRKRLIDYISSNFSDKNLEMIIGQFPGDRFLCTDILNSAIKTNTGFQPVIDVIDQCLNYPQAYNEAFILTAVDYLENIRKIRSAVEVIEKSKFLKNRDQKHIEIQYKLGQLYLENRDLKRALIQMKKVESIQRDYKKTDDMIGKINYLMYKTKNKK